MVNSKGRPYPYMIFRNMEALELTSVDKVLKVGDTIADIKEGVNAGIDTVGIIEGSSLMGLSQEEYEALSEDKKNEMDLKQYLHIKMLVRNILLEISVVYQIF